MKTAIALFSVAIFFVPFAIKADTLTTFITPSGSSVTDGSVNAKATFTTSSSAITILLENLQVNETSVGQSLSGLSFKIGPTPGSVNLSSSSAVERTIFSNDTFSDGATVATGWLFSSSSGNTVLNDLGGAAPKHTLIGPPGSGGYTNAGPSITNGPHTPSLGLSATFVLSLTGLTAPPTISNVVFSFGTEAGHNVSRSAHSLGLVDPKGRSGSCLVRCSAASLKEKKEVAILLRE